jgi:hypothetical protein
MAQINYGQSKGIILRGLTDEVSMKIYDTAEFTPNGPVFDSNLFRVPRKLYTIPKWLDCLK